MVRSTAWLTMVRAVSRGIGALSAASAVAAVEKARIALPSAVHSAGTRPPTRLGRLTPW
jgi:hypothetical protein